MAETKKQRILEYMQEFGKISQRTAYILGSMRLSAVIFQLKKEGWNIKTEMVTVKNKDGSYSRIAMYSLVDEEDGHEDA